jgi:hypothetical protein
MIHLQASGMPRAILHSEKRLLNALLQRLVQRLAALARLAASNRSTGTKTRVHQSAPPGTC